MNDLLEKLNQLRIKLSLKGENLDIEAPKGIMTPKILEEIKVYKNEIIAFLKKQSSDAQILSIKDRDFYPLSSAQNRLWLIHQMDPESVAYHIPIMLEIEGDLEVSKLQRTFQHLVQRHESLRTNFKEDPQGNPIQVIKEFTNNLFKLDYKYISENIDEEVQQFINSPFDLTEDLLIRGNILQTSEKKYFLVIVMHHIISDGWSIDVLTKDFFDIYANIDNNSLSLADLPIQYKDYSIWQQKELQSEEIRESKEYWTSNFNEKVSVLELPTYKTRPKHKSGKGKIVSVQINEHISLQFQKLCLDNKVTLFMGIKTLVDILLFKYSHQNDIIVGTPIANRVRNELQNQIGFYANTLALKANIDSAQSFLNLLNNNKIQLLNAYKYQEYPFDELVAGLKISYDPGRNPLFDVMLSLEEEPVFNILEIENLTFRRITLETNTSKFDLDFRFYMEKNKLNLDLTYDTEIYDEKFANNLTGHLHNLIEKIIGNKNLLIRDLNLLTEAERHQLLVEFNGIKVDYPKDKTIVELFESQVDKTPENIALVFEGTELSYRALNEQSNQLGCYLRHHYQIGPDDLVAIKLDRSEKMIVSILGVLKSGAGYVPIDVEYPDDRVSYIEEDTKAKVTIDDAFLVVFNTEVEKYQEKYRKENLSVISGPDNLAYVIYTSGTTGKPKGVMIENSNLSAYIFTFIDYFKINSFDVMLSQSTIAFDTSIEEIFPILTVGGKLVVTAMNKDLGSLIQICEKESVTRLSTNPYVIEYFNIHSDHLGKLNTFISGGDKLKANQITQLLKKVDIYNTYGPTEATVCCSYYKITEALDNIPIGRPISNTSVYILDEYLNVVPTGVLGKLYVSGAGLSRGYLNNAELTTSKFISNPFESGCKMYDTGDLARWLPDGNIEFMGRKDFQVKIRGYRIELGEIESNLSGFSPSIGQVVAEAKELNGDKVLVAYYTLAESADLNKTDLR
ncbi:amino acid adenylation domain-containing protein, partial [Chryseobacterium sp. G0240]|uniref:non-ribosomal peptide synthetase n=1 Tax=Chryseobacterium sp. G0240 TaxID=2487066 RepID=UPI000F4551CB